MMSTFRYALLLALLVFCWTVGACSKSATNNESANPDVPAVTDSSFQKEVLESDKPVLVDFWATWCGPCRMYGPIVDKMAEEYKGRLKVVRVDVDQNPALSRNYRIQAIPASFIMQKGNVVKSWVGLIGEEDLRQQINQALSSGPHS